MAFDSLKRAVAPFGSDAGRWRESSSGGGILYDSCRRGYGKRVNRYAACFELDLCRWQSDEIAEHLVELAGGKLRGLRIPVAFSYGSDSLSGV